MPRMMRYLYYGLGGFCLVLFLVVVFELTASLPHVDPEAVARREAGASAGAQPTEEEAAGLIAVIESAPLFSAERHPPEAPPAESEAEPPPEVKTAPELRGRLAGVTLGPDEEKHAVFARPGEKPTVVQEGDEIDGWTVSSIEPGQVVLSSSFGEKVIKPTPAVAGEGVTIDTSNLPHRAPTPPIPQPPRPVVPGTAAFPNMGNPANPVPNLVRPQPPQVPRGLPAPARRSQK